MCVPCRRAAAADTELEAVDSEAEVRTGVSRIFYACAAGTCAGVQGKRAC